MRLHCWACGKSVSSEVPADTVLRAVAICPECVEAGEATLRDDEAAAVVPDVNPTELLRAPAGAARCGALSDGRRCIRIKHHDESMNATPHVYSREPE